MFGFKSKQNDDEEKGERELQYWIATADDFSLSPTEFYNAVEQALNQMQVPGLTVERDEMAEGGMLSDQRAYLRLMRERITFYICAAQFGTRYFFSSRIVYLKPTLNLTQVLLIVIGLAAVFYGLTRFLDLLFAGIAMLGLVVAIFFMFRNVVALGLQDVDAMLLKIPAIGPFYERCYRKETYYRKDFRNMYLDTIPAVVQALADEVTGKQGIKLIRQYQSAPILGELYKPVPTRPAEPQ